MEKKLFLVLAFILVLFASGCDNAKSNIAPSNNSIGSAFNQPNISSDVEKVEIIHFHATNQCYSCITVGEYAEETVNTFFSEQIKQGKVSFVHINVDLPENSELVKKYGVTGSSLWIGVYDNNGFHKEENTNVWYKISNKEEYMTYLKGIIEKRLSGSFN